MKRIVGASSVVSGSRRRDDDHPGHAEAVGDHAEAR
jgi:hypothetical protein